MLLKNIPYNWNLLKLFQFSFIWEENLFSFQQIVVVAIELIAYWGAETRQKIEFNEEGRVVNPNKGSD